MKKEKDLFGLDEIRILAIQAAIDLRARNAPFCCPRHAGQVFTYLALQCQEASDRSGLEEVLRDLKETFNGLTKGEKVVHLVAQFEKEEVH